MYRNTLFAAGDADGDGDVEALGLGLELGRLVV
jgi:hypothetical protein